MSPTRPLTPCAAAGCHVLVRRGRCVGHARRPWSRRPRRRPGGSGWEWQRIRDRVLERDGYICQHCGARAVTADHIVGVAAGGSDEMNNLVASCADCNERRRREQAVAGKVALR